ncbi:MAG: hypothetical protein HYS26_04035 [Candidatus Kaiserbacteria bacterium]|nr:MAG: hypothetical protein HYS26_04035 [Candidatus Kaiserbacteria bacterium]
MRKRTPRANNHLLQDLGLVALSVLVALLLARTSTLADLVASWGQYEFFGILAVGMFFTSIFTTAPAIATLGEISLEQPILLVAFFGAMGSVLGDLLIFRFVRDRFSVDVMEIVRESKGLRRLRKIFHFKHFRWFTFFLGALVIASPLPDELGIALLGLSRASMRWFVAVSFGFNFLGIYLIGMAARALAS